MRRWLLALWLACCVARAEELAQHAQLIDLPTVLQLAGAQNLDIKIAEAKLAEARANHASAREQFFPWIAPGLAYRRHDGNTQAVTGEILDVDKQNYTVGATLTAQMDVGDALYKTLAARQLAQAADHAVAAQQQTTVFAAAQGFFDLAKAQVLVNVAREALRLSQDYEKEVHQAVAAGIAFKGDELRVRVQTQHNQFLLRQAQEQQRLAAARLAQTLHLDATVELVTRDADLVPLDLIKADRTAKELVAQALTARPELKQNQATLAAARAAQRGVRYGALIPTLSAQAFGGGLGGGINGQTENFGGTEDYFVGVSWRIGPGGLLDKGRLDAAAAQLRGTEWQDEKLKDEITRQVVEAQARVQAQADQLTTARQALAAAEENLRLTQQRKEFAVGIVLENIQAEQELTRARSDYFSVVAEFNKAQYALNKALGVTTETP